MASTLSVATASDPTQLSAQSPPFISIPGVLNARDLGGLPSAKHPGYITKRHTIFRSATLAKITPEGIERIKELNVSKVFDLRADVELAVDGEPLALAMANKAEGAKGRVDVVRAPVVNGVDSGPAAMFKYSKAEGFIHRYTEFLEEGGPAFSTIFRHLHDSPDEPCLIHCTGGKDRTGIAVALILSIAGVEDDRIAKDYALTSVGLAAILPAYIEKLMLQHPLLKSNPEVAVRMLGSTYETMIETLAMLRERYGGAEGYLRTHAGMSDEDLDLIRKHILVKISGNNL